MRRLLALGLVLSAALALPHAASALSVQEAILRAKPAVALITARVEAEVTMNCGQVLQNEQRSETENGASPDAAGAQTIVNNTYQTSHKVEKNVGAVGTVTRLTVAVLVDEKALQGGTGGRPKIRLESLESMVRDVVGADSTRGDRVTVLAVPFEPSAVAAGAAAAGFEPPKTDPIVIVERVSRPVVGLAALVVLLLLAFRLLRPVAGTTPAPATSTGGTGAQPGGTNGTESLVLRSRLPADGADRPEATAEIVRAWLAETR